MPLLQARFHRECGSPPQSSNPSRFNNRGAHRAVPEHLSNAQTARVYDAVVQNRRAPQTICSSDPRRSLLFRRCRRRRLFAVWRDQLHTRDKPHDQCSRRRGLEKGHGIWCAMIDFRCFAAVSDQMSPRLPNRQNYFTLSPAPDSVSDTANLGSKYVGSNIAEQGYWSNAVAL